MVRYVSISTQPYSTLVRYAFFVMVRLRYVRTVPRFCHGTGTVVGMLFEVAYQTLYVQHAAVNENSCDRARRAQTRLFSSKHYSLLICRYNCFMMSQFSLKRPIMMSQLLPK